MKTMLLGMCFLLVGCATHWDKAGGTYEGFLRDSYECERDMRMANSSFDTSSQQANPPANAAGAVGASLSSWSDTFARRAFFERCMYSKGYYKSE